MKCVTYPLNTLGNYKYVVILSHYRGSIMLSRHKQRDTWEAQGGHIEKGEAPLDAARRELYEESGATGYRIRPVFDYQSIDEMEQGENGMVFSAEIQDIGVMPESEIGEVLFFDQLPKQLTYPEITPVLFERAADMESSERD